MIYGLSDSYYVETLGIRHLNGPYSTWLEDQDVCRFNSHAKFFSTPAELHAHLSKANSLHRVDWAIQHTADGHVGNISLSEMSFINRTAEFSILIGNAAHHGRGLGEIASRKLLDHAFEKLNLNRVACGTAATNAGMIRLATKIGMVEEGRRRAALFLDASWVDVVEFGLLRADYLRGWQ